MKKYKETWNDVEWIYGDIAKKFSSKNYCKIKVNNINDDLITLILPTQLAYRITERCRHLNYYNRYYFTSDDDSIIITSCLVEVIHEFESWKNIKNIRKLIYG